MNKLNVVFQTMLYLFVLMFYVPVNNLSVVLGRCPVFLGLVSADKGFCSRTLYTDSASESRTSSHSIPSLKLYQLNHYSYADLLLFLINFQNDLDETASAFVLHM